MNVAAPNRTLPVLVGRWLPPLLLCLSVLVLWEAYVRIADVPDTILPAPSRIVDGTRDSSSDLFWHTRQTLMETVLGFALAVVVALLCATAVDFWPLVRRALFPLLIASQTIPVIALAPLLVLWFGYGAMPKVLVVGLVCFFPMVVAGVHGLTATDPELLRLYRTFGAGAWRRFLMVRVPTALPSLFAGMRIAVTYSVIGAVFGEYVGAERGLGIFLQTSKNAYRTDLVFAMIAVTAALSLTLYGLVSLVERLMIPWSVTPDRARETGLTNDGEGTT